jgi:hypothetical protein
MRVRKLLILLVVLCLFSGCCEMFGICTSASIHTSISGNHQYAQQSAAPSEAELALRSPESCRRE